MSARANGQMLRRSRDLRDERQEPWIDVRETLKPKRSGYSANNLFRIVDFPAPLGPDTTMGCFDGSVGAILERPRVGRVLVKCAIGL